MKLCFYQLAALGLLAFANPAQASMTYVCSSGLTLKIESERIDILNLDPSNPSSVRGNKTDYRPTPRHVGSTRFDISSVCDGSGDVYAILDRQLSSGSASGRLTIQSTCDADGNPPSYQIYSCKLKPSR